MKEIFVCGALLFGSLVYASGNQNTSFDYSTEIKSKSDVATPKTFKCKRNETLASCTKRFKKVKAMKEGN